MSQSRVAELFERARAATAAGASDQAMAALRSALEIDPNNPQVLNALANRFIASGNGAEARKLLNRAVQLDPGAVPLWLNLASAARLGGDTPAEIDALDRALAADPYCFPALLLKAQALERTGQIGQAAGVYRNVLKIAPDEATIAPAAKAAIDHARSVVAAEGEQALTVLNQRLAGVYETYEGADFRRANGYAEHVAGKRKVYQQQPVEGHFPYLPAIEYFDRSLFPWFGQLEAATDIIRADLLSLWEEQEPGFRPYVAFDPTEPVNQWGELNHSTRWSAWFLWENGVKDEAHCARCPATAAVMEKLPLLDIPGRGPTVMFSVLQPHTTIPPHTGSTNVRTTVHLPLVVPEGCRFRVGSETREWREGEAWAFDDTIEHEAWNDSDSPRAILILDTWNPLLSEHERAAVRVIG
jgi:aspartyl/asparaginyl beta-hydroxylase (cupin superfamily)